MIVNVLATAARGFAMGAADIVPGVSGGTIALILGIYQTLITSVRAGSSALGSLLRGDFNKAGEWFTSIKWSFILPLGFGMLAAIVALAHVIEQLLAEQPILMSALFLGLVAGSIGVAWRLLQDPAAQHAAVIIGVGLVVFILLGLTGGTSEDTVGQATDPAMWAFFGAGAIAICAMILPGVSGSFLLVVLGMYGPVLSAVTDRDFASLGVFVLGTVVGLALFSQVLYRALQNHHDVVMATLIGLMAGSLRVLWPWPNGVESTGLNAPDGQVAGAIAVAVVAFAAVYWLARLAQPLEPSPVTSESA